MSRPHTIFTIGPTARRRRPFRRLAVRLAILSVLAIPVTWALWSPFPRTEARFDRGSNAIWLGHQWVTGLDVRTDAPVPDEEREALLRRLEEAGIRYAFVHAGPILPDGSVADRPGDSFRSLVAAAPDVLFIPWLGGRRDELALGETSWRDRLLDTLYELETEGFTGVHYDIEPIHDHDDGYVKLLRDTRDRFGKGYFISHATRRAGPLGISVGPMDKTFWSEEFYRETMFFADQSVLMAYDTTIDVPKHYVAFVRHQTRLLLDWGCVREGHRVLIGIPTYEDVPETSNPRVENVRFAALGVRAALENHPNSDCFEGVAIYADWVTDADEWTLYQRVWRDRS